jgi:hypothetical protein
VTLLHAQSPEASSHVPAVPALQSASASQAQCPALHANPGVHARPHAPQLAASFVRSRQPLGVAQHTVPAPHAEPPLHVQASFVPG